MDYQIKCEWCGCKKFTMTLTTHSRLYFVRCTLCNRLMLIGGHDLMYPTIDDDRLQRRSILFRRFT